MKGISHRASALMKLRVSGYMDESVQRTRIAVIPTIKVRAWSEARLRDLTRAVDLQYLFRTRHVVCTGGTP